MNKNQLPIVRWTPVDSVPRQCLADDPTGSYHTLCGTDIDDPGIVNEIGTTHEYRKGRVTCHECKEIIKTVLKYYK